MSPWCYQGSHHHGISKLSKYFIFSGSSIFRYFFCCIIVNVDPLSSWYAIYLLLLKLSIFLSTFRSDIHCQLLQSHLTPSHILSPPTTNSYSSLHDVHQTLTNNQWNIFVDIFYIFVTSSLLIILWWADHISINWDKARLNDLLIAHIKQ